MFKGAPTGAIAYTNKPYIVNENAKILNIDDSCILVIVSILVVKYKNAKNNSSLHYSLIERSKKPQI